MPLNKLVALNGLAILALLVACCGAAAAPLPGGAGSLVESYDDWGVVCQMQATTPACAVRQVQTNNQTKQIVLTAEITKTPDGKFRGALVLPLGLSLQQGAQLKFDDLAMGDALPFSTCIPQGCVVPWSPEADAIAKLRTGKALSVTVTPISPANPISFSLSLKGFSNALNRVTQLTK